MTGATGMVGSHVARALVEAGHEVRCLVRRPDEPGLLQGLPVHRVRGDMTAPQTLRAAVEGMEAVVHAAGVVSYADSDRLWVWDTNVLGTGALLDAAIAAGVRRFVLTSSIAAVGYSTSGAPADEDTPFNWGPYNIGYCDTKRASERLVLDQDRIEGVAVNPGIVIGTQDLHFNGGRMIQQVHRGELPGVPPGSTTVCTAADVARGHVLALERGAPGRRYILGGHCMSFLELFQTIGRVLGKPVPSRVLPPALVRLAAFAQDLAAGATGRPAALSRQLAELVIRDRRCASRRAMDELGYTVSDLPTCIEGAFRWYVDRGLM